MKIYILKGRQQYCEEADVIDVFIFKSDAETESEKRKSEQDYENDEVAITWYWVEELEIGL